MRNRNQSAKFIVIAVVCFLIGVGTGLLCYHNFYRPEIILSMKIEPTVEMVEDVIYYENGIQQIIDIESED